MNIFEEEMKKLLPDGVPIIQVDNLGLLDILVSVTFSAYEAREEVSGVKILNPERNPFIFSWVTTLKQLPIVKELLPPHDKPVGLIRFVRKMSLKSSA
ncbi:hypothetical protein P3X46_023264 [Hevea brasiliensis]|uniref:GST C-terminal domain-containing protein n=1 Tax=Hevea brasiliensis TaxID=3981 RepID=A0ABQ9LDU0_HEVBR|nr:hypothetical protein P3X46_023264 [Hevea brasiliensis]